MYLFIQYLQINEYSTAKPRNVKTFIIMQNGTAQCLKVANKAIAVLRMVKQTFRSLDVEGLQLQII